MITAIFVLIVIGVYWRPFERWEGTITDRANESKVPRSYIMAMDFASGILMIIVTFGLPSAIMLVKPSEVSNALGLKDIASEIIFWGVSGAFAYFAISISRILSISAWSFFGFASVSLYSRGGWKSMIAYLIIPFVILGPVTKATNMLLTNSLGGVLSMVNGEINYVPITFFLVMYNVAIVLNGILTAPSQGQFMLTYFLEMFNAVADTHVATVYRLAEQGKLTSLPLLSALPDDYKELPMPLARQLLEKNGGRMARKLAPYLRKGGNGELALTPEAADIVTPDADGQVRFK